MGWFDAVIPAATTLIGGYMANRAAGKAANAQASAAQAGIDEQRRATDLAIQEQRRAAEAAMQEQRAAAEQARQLLAPYVQFGNDSLAELRGLTGLNGQQAQTQAMSALRSGAEFNNLNKAGQDAILSNASATGGLRGGNVQRSLADYSSGLLDNLINKRAAQLGGFVGMGHGSASGLGTVMQGAAGGIGNLLSGGASAIGNYGVNSGVNIANLLAQQGAANAGGIMSRGNTNINMLSGLGKLASYGMGRFG